MENDTRPVTLSLNLTPVELTLLLDTLRGRVDELDTTYARVRAMAEEADAIFLFNDDMETNRLMRGVYARMAHQVGQLLETPFLDTHEGVNLLWAEVGA